MNYRLVNSRFLRYFVILCSFFSFFTLHTIRLCAQSTWRHGKTIIPIDRSIFIFKTGWTLNMKKLLHENSYIHILFRKSVDIWMEKMKARFNLFYKFNSSFSLWVAILIFEKLISEEKSRLKHFYIWWYYVYV